VICRGDVFWVNLDPTIGAEIKKTRPALVISPDDLNHALPRVIIAPLTSKGQAWVVGLKLCLTVENRASCSIKFALSIKCDWSASSAQSGSQSGIPS
jgi:mRNA-degrading endonuclease toxin of MazEF toxin-antitoxin module